MNLLDLFNEMLIVWSKNDVWVLKAVCHKIQHVVLMMNRNQPRGVNVYFFDQQTRCNIRLWSNCSTLLFQHSLCSWALCSSSTKVKLTITLGSFTLALRLHGTTSPNIQHFDTICQIVYRPREHSAVLWTRVQLEEKSLPKHIKL